MIRPFRRLRERRLIGVTMLPVVAASALFAAGCGSSGSSASSAGPARIALAEPVCSIAPSGFQAGDTIAGVGIGELLTRPRRDGGVEPWLAQSFQRTGDSTWQFQLRPQARFHNGRQVTADAVVAALKRDMSTGYSAYTQDALTGSTLEVNGPLTFTVHTKQPSGTVPYDLAGMYSYPIYDVAAADQAGKDPQALVAAGIWTGPYKPVSVTPQQIVTQRFDGWWNGSAALPGTTLLCVPDGQARVLAVQSGQADIALNPPSSARLALAGNARAIYVPAPVAYTATLLQPNVTAAPFDDQRVRQAFALSIDYAALAAAVPNRPFQTATGLFPAQLPFTVSTQHTDRTQAAALLTQAGWVKDAGGVYTKNGRPLKVVLLYSPSASPDHQALAVALAAQLTPLGFDVVPQQIGTVYDNQGWPAGWSADLNLVSLQGLDNDPAQSIASYLGSRGGQNWGRVADPALDGLLTQLSGNLGTPDGNTVLGNIQQQIAGQGEGLVLGFSSPTAVVDQAYRDFVPDPLMLPISGTLKPAG